MPGDYLLFATTLTLLTAVVTGWQLRKRLFRLMWIPVLFALGTLLTAAWFGADRAAQKEELRLRQTVAGLAPTYAAEMERMGHEQLKLDTSGDDPRYLEIVNAQTRWLRSNTQISSMYTYRVDAEGKVRFVVGCESDYDRNGKIEGEREARVPIGEHYVDADPSLVAAYRGETLFNSDPAEDRWGVWVSAFYPLRDAAGKIEAVVGVDFDAREWIAAMARARQASLIAYGLTGGVGLAFLAMAGMWLLARENSAQRRQSEALQVERVRFEMLVDSIDGIVWEANPDTGRFQYVSRQAELLLGFSSDAWTAEDDFYERRLHAEDREWVLSMRRELGRDGKPWQLEYRMLHADDKVMWFRERGQRERGAAGQDVLRGVFSDITREREAACELEATNRQLVDASRRAGMAEVATGVLHNVGNVLNSVNISSTVIHGQLDNSRVSMLQQLAALVMEQGERLPEFLRSDERGRMIPGFLRELADHIATEHQLIGGEMKNLVKSVEHMKEIVLMQQNYSRIGGSMELLDLPALLDDAMQINATAFSRHRIQVVKRIQPVPPVLAERGKVLQILVNLIRNAKHALDEGRSDERVLTLSVEQDGQEPVRVAVQDNGTGIAPEILPRIFSYGFTTKVDGHGFGLHSGAAAAREMGGRLKVESGGNGLGAKFTLELPAVNKNLYLAN